jgi:hypothetical protein
MDHYLTNRQLFRGLEGGGAHCSRVNHISGARDLFRDTLALECICTISAFRRYPTVQSRNDLHASLAHWAMQLLDERNEQKTLNNIDHWRPRDPDPLPHLPSTPIIYFSSFFTPSSAPSSAPPSSSSSSSSSPSFFFFEVCCFV